MFGLGFGSATGPTRYVRDRFRRRDDLSLHGHRALATVVSPARHALRAGRRRTRGAPARAARRGPGAGRRSRVADGAGAGQRRLHGRAAGRADAGRARRQRDRSVSAGKHARRRRHGPGLAGGARRWPVPAPRRAEAAAPRPDRHQPAAALHARAADPGAPGASAHRAPARCRRQQRWLAVPGAGVRRRRADHRLLPQPSHAAGSAAAHVPADLRRGQPRARQPDRSPRPQAVQHPGHAWRRHPPARFRHRQAARQRCTDGRADAHRRAHLHAALRRARADPRRAGHDDDRRVLAGRGAVRAAHRHQALQAQAADRCGVGGGDPRRRSAAALADGAASRRGCRGRHARCCAVVHASSPATSTTSC